MMVPSISNRKAAKARSDSALAIIRPRGSGFWERDQTLVQRASASRNAI